jgi:Dolichyl-phosphate-mannose-protein mannosyltransferase
LHGLESDALHALKYLRTFVVLYPVALFAFFSLVCWCAWKLLPGKTWALPYRVQLAAGFALAPTIALVGYAIVWLVSPVVYDCTVAQIAAVSYRFALYHEQLYEPLEAGARYSLLYGPAAYLVHMPAFILFGGSLFTAKLTGVIAFLAALWFIYRACRALASISESIIALGLVCLVLGSFQFYAFCNRPEPFLLLCVAIPVWMIATGRERWVFLVTGVSAALAIGLKITAVLYFVPVFAFLLYRAKSGRVLAGLSTAVVLCVLPFLLPTVSLVNYLALLRNVAGHGIILQNFLDCVQLAVLLLVLILSAVLWRSRAGAKLPPQGAIYLASLAFAIAGVCVIGAKPGSGSHHLIPFLGILPPTYFWLRPSSFPDASDRGAVPFFVPLALTLCVLGIIPMAQMARVFPADFREGNSMVNETDSILRGYPGQSIEMGYGDNIYEPSTYLRTVLVFAGNQYTLDGVALQDDQFGGKELPAASTWLLDECHTDIWLIPKDEQPFATHNGYNTELSLFDDEFRTAFLTHYHRIESRRFFDVWRCANHK